MQQETIVVKPLSENTSKMLFLEPEFIEEIFFEPGTESIYAKHLFASKSIFIGIIPKEYVSLFTKKLIRVKSWKLIPETSEIQLHITLNDK